MQYELYFKLHLHPIVNGISEGKCFCISFAKSAYLNVQQSLNNKHYITGSQEHEDLNLPCFQFKVKLFVSGRQDLIVVALIIFFWKIILILLQR